MPKLFFPEKLWDGTTLSRTELELIRSPDHQDYKQIVQEVQNIQSSIFGNIGIRHVCYPVSLSGSLPGTYNFVGNNFTILSGLTANHNTEIIVGNNRLGLTITTLIGNGTVTVIGDSINPRTAKPTLGDTEVILIDSTGKYQTSKNWLRVTSIIFQPTITLLNYSVQILNYLTFNDKATDIYGWRADISKIGATSATLQLKLDRIKDHGNNKYSLLPLEDITYARTPAVLDAIRFGPNSRSYNSNVAPYFDNPNYLFVARQLDFPTFFTAGENSLDGTKNEGLIASIIWSNIDFITFYLVYSVSP